MGFFTDLFTEGLYGAWSNLEAEQEYKNICERTGLPYMPVDSKAFENAGNTVACGVDTNSVSEEQTENKGTNIDMKMMKFQKMIEDIKNAIVPIGRSSVLSSKPEETYYLALIYDYNTLNDYGKIIMRQCNKDADSLCRLYKDEKTKKNMAWELIDGLDEITSRKFIFWAMLMLTVDSTNKEEHLSLICDFAKVLKITDEEMLDIATVIQVINDSAEERIVFHSRTIPSYFRHVFGNYGYGSEVEHYQSYYNSNISYIAEEEIKVWEKYD